MLLRQLKDHRVDGDREVVSMSLDSVTKAWTDLLLSKQWACLDDPI
jgi:hypothetical protein